MKYNEGILYSTSKDKHVNVYRFNKSEEGMSQEGTFLKDSKNNKDRYYLAKIS